MGMAAKVSIEDSYTHMPCGKKPYATQIEARQVLEKAKSRHKRAHIYQCHFCNGHPWHVSKDLIWLGKR